MRPAALPHPGLPVPATEQKRLLLALHLALTELLQHDGLAVADAAAAALILRTLLQDYEAAGAAEAAEAALAALAALHRGQTTPAAAQAACEPLVPYFEAAVTACTWRRLVAAQTAARRELLALGLAR